MRRAPGSGAGSDRRGGAGLSSAGRSIVGAARPGSASSSVKPGSTAAAVRSDIQSRPASRSSAVATRRIASESKPTSKDKPVFGGAAASAGAAVAAQATSSSAAAASSCNSEDLDDQLREAVLGIFEWCDADEDGILNAAEFAAAQRLIAELCPADFDEASASKIFDGASDGGVGGLVDKDGFLKAVQSLVNALKVSRHHLIDGLKRQTSRRSSKFDRSVSDFKQALVRNVSNLPDEKRSNFPPPLSLWRTDTGGHSFSFPPGAADGSPAAQMAFKMMQYLGMKTEDSSFIEGELAAKMMGHRQMFRDILNMCGDIKGVHVLEQGTLRTTVDLFLAQSMSAEQMFRVRVTGMQLQMAKQTKLIGMGGFEPTPIDPSDIPSVLFKEMQLADGDDSNVPDLSALGQAPPPPDGLTRQKSLMGNEDLQVSDLVLTANTVGRHVIRIRFKLADSSMSTAPHYLLLLPRIKSADTGHARYRDHEVRVKMPGVGMEPLVKTFNNFVLASIRGHAVARLAVEHEFTSCQVRVQARAAAKSSDIVPVPKLSPEERAFNLAGDHTETLKLRKLLESQGLARKAEERDIAYAVRLGRALGNGYEYDVDITEEHVKNLTSLIWEKKRGDCSAFNAGFVYALRAFNVPARVSLGFKYGRAVKQACGAACAPHCEAEFYAEGIGWVPCDATLGLKRLGHDGGTALTFVEWRPSNLSLDEAEEVAKVLQPPVHPDVESLRKRLDELTGGDTATDKEMAHVVSKLYGLPKHQAEQHVTQVLRVSNLAGQTAAPSRDFARCWAAVELGKFSELGAGGGLTSTSKAGVKFYEGGPFKDSPLELKSLKENMMVPDDVEKVVQTVGGRPVAYDWSSMWPYGVFLCNYEFEEKAVS